jgi:hypothetical protein
MMVNGSKQDVGTTESQKKKKQNKNCIFSSSGKKAYQVGKLQVEINGAKQDVEAEQRGHTAKVEANVARVMALRALQQHAQLRKPVARLRAI